MKMKRILSKIAALAAVISMGLAVIDRLFCADKALFGMSALSYLRITNTMLLFAIAFLLLADHQAKG